MQTTINENNSETTNTWEMQIVANGEMNYFGHLTDKQIKSVVEFANSLVENKAFIAE